MPLDKLTFTFSCPKDKWVLDCFAKLRTTGHFQNAFGQVDIVNSCPKDKWVRNCLSHPDTILSWHVCMTWWVAATLTALSQAMMHVLESIVHVLSALSTDTDHNYEMQILYAGAPILLYVSARGPGLPHIWESLAWLQRRIQVSSDRQIDTWLAP